MRIRGCALLEATARRRTKGGFGARLQEGGKMAGSGGGGHLSLLPSCGEELACLPLNLIRAFSAALPSEREWKERCTLTSPFRRPVAVHSAHEMMDSGGGFTRRRLISLN